MIEFNRDFAAVGNEVWVGGSACCNRARPQFAGAIHLWKPANLIACNDGVACRHLLDRRLGDLVVEWREDQGTAHLSVPLDGIAAYARGTAGPLLVHCLSGSCRSTAIAVACKVARGCEVFDAIGEVARTVYRQRGFFVGWRQDSMAEIIRWADAQPAR